MNTAPQHSVVAAVTAAAVVATAAAADPEDAVILIVDDVAFNRQILGTVLRKAGYQVLTADSAQQALHQIRLRVPELIMMDIMMPGTDGLSLCRSLLAAPETCQVPIIFLSALNDSSDKVKAFASGGVDYVTKPFHADELLARVAHQLKTRRLQAELLREKAELLRLNQQLQAAQKQTAALFGALTEILPGLILDGKYRIEEKIGSGGSGVVYRATHLALQRAVAVKVFRPDTPYGSASALSRFQLEGISTCRVNHPSAVAVLDSGISSQGVAYLVMELLNGPTLYTELLQAEKFSLARCLQVILPLCNVLIAAHAAGIVHRDIKPENVMLHHTPSGDVVKVLDFGIAKRLGDEQPGTGPVVTGRNELIGTPIYMAPERLSGSAYDGKSDVFSMGVLFYELLTGQVPFTDRGQSYFKVMFNHLHAQPTPLGTYRPELSGRLPALLMRALAKDPAQRPTAQEFRDALIELVNAELVNAETPILSTAPLEVAARGVRGARSRSSAVPPVSVVLSKKAAAELLQEWNAGESDPFIEIRINADLS